MWLDRASNVSVVETWSQNQNHATSHAAPLPKPPRLGRYRHVRRPADLFVFKHVAKALRSCFFHPLYPQPTVQNTETNRVARQLQRQKSSTKTAKRACEKDRKKWEQSEQILRGVYPAANIAICGYFPSQ